MENLIESYLVSLGLKLSIKNQYLKIDDYDYQSSLKEIGMFLVLTFSTVLCIGGFLFAIKRFFDL